MTSINGPAFVSDQRDCSSRSLWFYDAQGWALRLIHAFAEEKTGVRRLIVADVLPGDAESILRIVHERDEAMAGGNGRAIDGYLFVVSAGKNDFSPPVAKQIGAQNRRGFGSIIGESAFRRENVGK